MIKKIFCLVLVLLILCYVIPAVLIIVNSKSTIKEKVDYVIVLGAKVNGNKPTAALKGRLDQAITYYNSNPSVKIVVTGGQGSDELYPESLVMKNYLLDNKVKASNILVEDKSSNTYENLYFAKRVIDKDSKDVTYQKIGVITNDFHILRAKMLCYRQFKQECQMQSAYTDNNYLSYVREPLALIKSLLLDT
jgi:uncharacterized SAM-binding protein YcdF (DUF218 family)